MNDLPTQDAHLPPGVTQVDIDLRFGSVDRSPEPIPTVQAIIAAVVNYPEARWARAWFADVLDCEGLMILDTLAKAIGPGMTDEQKARALEHLADVVYRHAERHKLGEKAAEPPLADVLAERWREEERGAQMADADWDGMG